MMKVLRREEELSETLVGRGLICECIFVMKGFFFGRLGWDGSVLWLLLLLLLLLVDVT